MLKKLLIDNVSTDFLLGVLCLMLLIISIYILYKVIQNVKWWNRSKKYVKEKMKLNDLVYISTYEKIWKFICCNVR
jgi:hypothetical protein